MESDYIKYMLFEIYVEGINLLVSLVVVKNVTDVTYLVKLLLMIEKCFHMYSVCKNLSYRMKTPLLEVIY